MEDTQISSRCAELQDCCGRTNSPKPGASGGAGLILNCIFRVEEEVGENVGGKRRGSIAPSDSKIMWF